MFYKYTKTTDANGQHTPSENGRSFHSEFYDETNGVIFMDNIAQEFSPVQIAEQEALAEAIRITGKNDLYLQNGIIISPLPTP